MTPKEYKQMMDYLTRSGIKDQVKFASDIAKPVDKFEVQQIKLFNEFNTRNPRTGKAGGGMLVQPGFGGKRQGYKDEKEYKRFKKTVTINGKKYGIITKKNDPNFGKYVYRGNKGSEYFDNINDLKARIKKGGKGRKFTGFSKGYLAELEDIKKFVDNKGAKNIFLSDLVEKFGDTTKSSDDSAVRDATTEKKIKRAIGDDEYKKLIKGGDRAKTTIQKKKDANALVRAINRGDKPLISLSSDMTGEAPNVFKSYLGKTEKNMYDSIIPKLRAIVSRVTQPRQIYQATGAVEELKKATTKTFNQIIKKYPQAQAARNVLTSGKGIVAYNDRSYILSQLFRHVQNGGTKYKYVSGDTTATIKFRNNETGKLINLNNIDVNDPEFKEAADAYNQKERIMNTEIDDPRIKGSKIKIGQAIAANGDSIVIDHLDDVKNNPLKNLVITNQKANIAATIKGATKEELKSIGRGLKLSLEDNTKRFSNYAKRLLISPDKKRPGPKETIFKKTGTLRGVTDPPDIEIKRLITLFADTPQCEVFSRKPKSDGGRIPYQTGDVSLSKCVTEGARNFNDGKLKTADQIQDGVKLLRGGRAVLSALSKYGIVPELAYVGLEAAGRTVLGEKPTNALLKSIDTLTFGATDFTSEIEAEKFGEYAKDKLAVDKFQESQAKVRSILDNISRLEQLNLEGGEIDVTQDIQTLKAQLKSASDELRANTVNPDMVQFITQRGDEIADAELAKSPFAKRSLTDQLEGFPGIKDYTDTEATRVFPFQQTQQQLNEKVLNTPFLLRAKTSDIINDIVPALRAQGVTVDGRPISTKDVLNYQKQLREQPLSEVVAQGFNPESLYGASGTFSTPLPGGALDKKPNVIPEMEREIVGQTNVANPFDIDISDIGGGLRGFSAAGGGIAKQAGVSSGPPPESGPMSQGLQGLMKRVRNL